MKSYTNLIIPNVTLQEISNDGNINIINNYFFKNKRVVVFSVPGAFTPTCTTKQLPDFEKAYDEIVSLGISEVYCLSVNDSFVMKSWRKFLGIKKVKFLADNTAAFTEKMGMLVDKKHLGMGMRSWRYTIIINNMLVEALLEEPGRTLGRSFEDPYKETSPKNILKYLKTD